MSKKRILNSFLYIVLCGVFYSLPVLAQIQNPSSGVYSITESSASDSQLHLKNTQSSGISRLLSIGGNGTVTTQMISDPTTSLSRFGSASTGIDVDLFTARDLFLSTTSGSTLTPRLTVKQSGAVGINTLTPQKLLEVQTVSNDTVAFGKQLAVGEWTGIQFGYLEPWNTYYRKAAIVFERTDSTSARGKIHLLNNISDQPNSAGISDARLTIDETGKVGIGTATPMGQLDVFGTTVIRNYSGSDGLRILRGADTNSPAFQVTIDSTAPYINSWGPLVFQTGATGSNPGERLRIATNGNVGVNNSNPSKTLDINGTFGVNGQTTMTGMTWIQSGDLRLGDSVASPSIRLSGPNNWDFYLGIKTDKVYLRRNSDPKFTFTSDGRLGVGTTMPTARLEISDLANNETALHINAAGVGTNVPLIRFQQNSQSKWGLFAEYPTSGLFSVFSNGLNDVVMTFKSNGNVGIGVTNPDSKLVVNGTIKSKEVVVTLNGFADFVFSPTYNLRPLTEVKAFISRNSHLPEFPSEKEVLEKGLGLGAMQVKLVQKVEELTLYAISLEEKNKALEEKIKALESLCLSLEKRFSIYENTSGQQRRNTDAK